MLVGVCHVSLFFSQAHSLKEKRMVLKSILDRIRTRLHLAAAEIGEQDLWQRGEIAFAAIGCEEAILHSALMAGVKIVESEPRLEVLNVEVEWR